MCVDTRELRQAKMQLWTHDRCSQARFWGRSVRNNSQLCAGYVSGYITACNVRHVVPSPYFSVRCLMKGHTLMYKNSSSDSKSGKRIIIDYGENSDFFVALYSRAT